VSTEHEFHVEQSLQTEAGAVIYRMSGVLGDAHACYEFLEDFKEALPELPARIVFNLSALDNMYSSGVGIVAASFTSARRMEKSLCLVGVPENIDRTLKITGIRPEVPAYETEEEALAAPIE
jgi:anti-anti-sigma factor